MPFPEDINDFSFSIPSFSGEDLEGIFEDQFVNFSYEEDPLEFDEDADWTSQAKTSLPFPSGNSNNLVDAAPEKVQSASTAGSEQNDSLVSLQSAARTAAKAARRRKHKFVPKRLTPLPDNFEPTNYSILW